MVQMPSEAIDLICEFEGKELTAYKCSAGVLTIGYGHTSAAGDPKVTPGMTITEDEAESILRRDLRKYQDAVTSSVKVSMTDNQFGAFTSLCYNIGPGAFRKSTAVRRFNAGDVSGAAEALTWFNKSRGKVLKGLVRRREAERALFLTPDTPEVEESPTGRPDGPVTGGEAKSLATSKTTLAGGTLFAGLGVYTQIKEAMPEVAEYAPYILAAIAAFIIFNRVMEAHAGEH